MSRTNPEEELAESTLHEAAKNGIVALVRVMSDTISVEAKRARLLRIADDLTRAVTQAQEEA